MSGTSIDTACVQLVAVFTAVQVPKVTVIDGPAFDPPNNFLAVGWDRSGQPAVIATGTQNTYGTTSVWEQAEVSSLLSFAYDDGAITAVRAKLLAAFNQYATALGLNPTLNGTVLGAQITAYDFTPILTEAGTVADLRFTTTLRASV